MDKLIAKKQLMQATRRRTRNQLGGIVYRLSGMDRVSQLYESIHDKKGTAFIRKSLEQLDLHIEIDSEELKRIPENGAFITISNHPFGTIDGLSLLLLLGERRPHYKVLTNILLHQVPQISDRFIAVNPFEGTQQSDAKGWDSALVHLRNGYPLGIFPAGEVSTYQRGIRTISDGPWNDQSIKLIQKAEMPVIPVYFDGKNSRLFHLLAAIHPSLRTLRLPVELMNIRRKRLRVRIGKPISQKDISSFGSTKELSRFLRAKTYALGSGIEVQREYFSRFKVTRKPDRVIEAMPKERLCEEIEMLSKNRLFEYRQFECYVAGASKIPNILKEIGRLRELAFRDVGEGTNKPLDLDGFDLHYDHLFLWDTKTQCIAGAYRIGRGSQIMQRYGVRGFYTSTLFQMSGPMEQILHQSLELGRSYITLEYQKQRMPLFLLWKGILLVLTGTPEYRYIIGPVTISGTYAELSKGLMIEFIKRHYYDHKLAAHVKPRLPYVVAKMNMDHEALLNAAEGDVKKMDRIIADIEPLSMTVPVLLKKYLNQNARILGFNLDPLFNDALDGLMLLDLSNLPPGTVENLQREFGQT